MNYKMAEMDLKTGHGLFWLKTKNTLTDIGKVSITAKKSETMQSLQIYSQSYLKLYPLVS